MSKSQGLRFFKYLRALNAKEFIKNSAIDRTIVKGAAPCFSGTLSASPKLGTTFLIVCSDMAKCFQEKLEITKLAVRIAFTRANTSDSVPAPTITD